MGIKRTSFLKNMVKRVKGWPVCYRCGKPHWFVCNKCGHKWHSVMSNCHPGSCPKCSQFATADDLDEDLIPIIKKTMR